MVSYGSYEGLSHWHIMEVIMEEEKLRQPNLENLTPNSISKRFGVEKGCGRVYTSLERLRLKNQYVKKKKIIIIKKNGKEKHTYIYLLTEKAKKILEENNIYSFLDSKNHKLKYSKRLITCKKKYQLGKLFTPYI